MAALRCGSRISPCPYSASLHQPQANSCSVSAWHYSRRCHSSRKPQADGVELCRKCCHSLHFSSLQSRANAQSRVQLMSPTLAICEDRRHAVDSSLRTSFIRQDGGHSILWSTSDDSRSTRRQTGSSAMAAAASTRPACAQSNCQTFSKHSRTQAYLLASMSMRRACLIGMSGQIH